MCGMDSVDTQFETLLQDLPVDLVASAREFRAFARARQIKTPQELLRVVLLYCGLDQSLRTVAGNLTLLEERITDSSVMARLKACEPWVKARLGKLRTTGQNPTGGRSRKPPIQSSPGTVEPTDPGGGQSAQTERRNCGTVPRLGEACRRQVAVDPARGLAGGSPPPGPAAGRVDCHRPHRLGPWGNSAHRTPAAESSVLAAAPPTRRVAPECDSRRCNWLGSPLPLAAWPGHHKRAVRPCHISPDRPVMGPSVGPFFCRLLGAVEEDLIPVDAVQGLVARGQLLPRLMEHIERQPEFQPSLDRFIGGKSTG